MTNLTDPAQKSADPAEAFERAIEKSVAGPLGKLGESMKGLTEGQAELAKRLATVEERLASATSKRDELAAAGRTRLADRLTTRIDSVNERLPRAQARIERISGLLAEKCPAA